MKRLRHLMNMGVFSLIPIMGAYHLSSPALAGPPYLNNLNVTLTTTCYDKSGQQCPPSDWTVTGTMSVSGESLNDSSCAIGGYVEEPIENEPIAGNVSLTNWRLQDPSTCPDAKALALYNGNAQSFEISGQWLEIDPIRGYYVWTFLISSESSGKGNGNIGSYIAGQFDWEYPNNGDTFVGNGVVDTSFN
jgi:hypothetical protein